MTIIDTTRTSAPSERTFLSLVDELEDASADGYANLSELFARTAKLGWPAALTEDMVDLLEEAGLIEEPMVGKLRRA